jgi:type IV secretory pathway VirJ component
MPSASLRCWPPNALDFEMAEVRALCVYSDDDESSCADAASATLHAVSLPGGHHFGGDYDRVAALILEQVL